MQNAVQHQPVLVGRTVGLEPQLLVRDGVVVVQPRMVGQPVGAAPMHSSADQQRKVARNDWWLYVGLCTGCAFMTLTVVLVAVVLFEYLTTNEAPTTFCKSECAKNQGVLAKSLATEVCENPTSEDCYPRPEVEEGEQACDSGEVACTAVQDCWYSGCKTYHDGATPGDVVCFVIAVHEDDYGGCYPVDRAEDCDLMDGKQLCRSG
mmetsp:Transcript_56970/g.144553  ORF Transcript_56970/g.144553 Transcript_56970/m.144553 type:complete len:206 (-) Transcript_56970:133-750(-)